MFTKGKKAIGICDNCGFQWPLARLKYETLAGRQTKLRKCPDCLDPDDPKDRPGIWIAKPEAIAVRDPRPDPATAGMNSLVGWAPVLGTEIPVYPVADGFSMSYAIEAGASYLRTETGLRILTEDGRLIQVG